MAKFDASKFLTSVGQSITDYSKTKDTQQNDMNRLNVQQQGYDKRQDARFLEAERVRDEERKHNTEQQLAEVQGIILSQGQGLDWKTVEQVVPKEQLEKLSPEEVGGIKSLPTNPDKYATLKTILSGINVVLQKNPNMTDVEKIAFMKAASNRFSIKKAEIDALQKQMENRTYTEKTEKTKEDRLDARKRIPTPAKPTSKLDPTSKYTPAQLEKQESDAFYKWLEMMGYKGQYETEKPTQAMWDEYQKYKSTGTPAFEETPTEQAAPVAPAAESNPQLITAKDVISGGQPAPAQGKPVPQGKFPPGDYPEGSKATDKTTGEIMIKRGGRWVYQ